MVEGGDDNPLSEAPALSVTQFVLTHKPSEEVIRAEGELGPKGAVKAVAKLPALIARDSIQGGTDPNNVQTVPEGDTWTPTLLQGNPQTSNNEITASSARG